MITHEVYLASDHAGVTMRLEIAAELRGAGHIVHDLSSDAAEKTDYSDVATSLAKAMKPVADARGVLICGSGIGVSIAANRFSWIRTALCHDITTAKLARQHNDANVIALGARLIGMTTARHAVAAFLDTEFEGGRHIARVNKLNALH